MNTNYVYPSAQVGEFRNAMLYGSGPASYASTGDPVYNPGSGEYINFPCDATTLSGNYKVRFVPLAVGFNQIRAGGGGTSSAPSPSISGWTAIWEYSGANGDSPVAGVPLSLGTLSAAATQSTYTASGLLTIATTTPPPLGSFVVLSNGASSYGILFDGVMAQVIAVVPGVSYSVYFGQGLAGAYTVNTDTLKWQQVQVNASNVLQAQLNPAPITGVLATAILLTVTQANSYVPGQFVALGGTFKTASLYAGGAIVQIASASSTGWTAKWVGTIIAQTSGEVATSSLLVTNGGAPIQAYPQVNGPTAAISNTLAVASSSSTAGLLTLTATQGYVAGQLIVVNGVATNTTLNGIIATVIASGLTSALIKANGWTLVANTSADTGTASLLVTGSPASGNQVAAGVNLSGESIQFAALAGSTLYFCQPLLSRQ